MSNQTLRIIDANLDRATEGLRVLEDIARFVLDDASLSGELKTLRHSIHQACPDIAKELVSARDTVGDVGRKVEHRKEAELDLMDTVSANSRRVEQSLRVLEEISRTPGMVPNGTVFEEARYAMYSFEKELISRLSRQGRIGRLSRYSIIENKAQLGPAIDSDITALQIEQGTLSKREYYNWALQSKQSCDSTNILMIVTGQPDIAMASGADGVALDEYSMPISIVRSLLKIDQLIGYSAKNAEEAAQAQNCGADYILCPKSVRAEILSAVNIPVISPVREEQ
ncbi:MAG: thiamine phosphate synthase [Dehalogenimonas sp.]